MTEELLSRSVREFVAATADKTPTPGGGSVAGVVGALAAALGEMSLNFTRGKKKYAEHEPFYAHLGARLSHMRDMFAALVSDDVAAYTYYQETSKLPDGPEKIEAVQTATAAAIQVPVEMTKLSLALLEDLRSLCDKCNPWLISDLVAAAVLAVATARLSNYNVRINVPNLTDKEAAADIRATSMADVARAQAMFEEIEKASVAHLDRV